MDLNPADPWEHFMDYLSLFEFEEQYMASENYHQDHIAQVRRKEAMGLIYYAYIKGTRDNNNPKESFVPIVALIYFDRFFSRRPMQQVISMADVAKFAFACLSLAWKSRTTNFSLLRLMDSIKINKVNYMAQVTTTELLILNTLKWQMRFLDLSFLDFFVSFINTDMNPQAKFILKVRAANFLVKNMYTMIEFTQFKPSIIAASALVFQSRLSGQPFDPSVHFHYVLTQDELSELNRCIHEIEERNVLMGYLLSMHKAQRPRIMNAAAVAVDRPGPSNPVNHGDEAAAQRRRR